MRRWIAVLVLALTAPAAHAWTDAVPLTTGLVQDPQLASAPDGTVVTAWRTPADALAVRIGDAPPVVLDVGGGAPQVAAGDDGQAVVVWDGGAGHTTAVLFGPGGRQAGPPEVVAPGQPFRVAMNAAGDASLATFRTEDSGVVDELAFRPAGGAFGVPAALSATGLAFNVQALALSPSGETLLGLSPPTGTGLQIYDRERDGALNSPVTLDDLAQYSGPGPFGAGAVLAFDASGRALALYSRFSGVFTAVRSTDGHWSAPALIPGAEGVMPTNLAAGVDTAGDAVVALRDQVLIGKVEVSAPGRPYLATGSLADGVFAPITALPDPTAYGSGLDVASAPDGSTTVAWGEGGAGTLHAVTRTGTGPFGPAELAACSLSGSDSDRFGQPAAFAAPGLLLSHDGLAADLPGTPTCHRTRLLRLSTNPPRAGRPVRLDARRMVDRGYAFAGALFRFPHHARSEPLRATHTFARPGRFKITIVVTETSLHDGGRRVHRETFTVRVVA